MNEPTAIIVEGHLPLDTALRRASELRSILQVSRDRAVIYPRLLPGYKPVYGGGEVHRVPAPEAA